ncbi:MAG: NADH-quinone oxidoreductase subunit J, partial [Desulfobaccales bacterium]
METLFFVLGAVALISGGLVVFQPHPLRSALWLIVNFFAVAGIYLLAHAEFIAAIQVIVYAGAIIVLFLFVIMLLNLRLPEETPKLPFIGQKFAGAVLAGFTALIMIYAYTRVKLPAAREMVPGLGNTEMIARSLFTGAVI